MPLPVPPDREGLRLDAYLSLRLKGHSRARARRLIDQGLVRLPGRPAKAARRVRAGERVLLRYPRRPEEPARYAALSVLYEDEALLAVQKPGDLLCHPTDKVVANSVTAVLKGQFPGRTLRLVHRLDRETSGALLLAKTASAARDLTAQFTARSVHKEYWALVRGRWDLGPMRVEAALGAQGGDIKVRQAVASAGAGGREAVTEIEPVLAGENVSWVRARPRTGRLHQVRVHLAWLGHPLLGDKLYQEDARAYRKACRKEIQEQDLVRLGAPRQMLHARALCLRHPQDGRPWSVLCPPPEDFLRVLGSHFPERVVRSKLEAQTPAPSRAPGKEERSWWT